MMNGTPTLAPRPELTMSRDNIADKLRRAREAIAACLEADDPTIGEDHWKHATRELSELYQFDGLAAVASVAAYTATTWSITTGQPPTALFRDARLHFRTIMDDATFIRAASCISLVDALLVLPRDQKALDYKAGSLGADYGEQSTAMLVWIAGVFLTSLATARGTTALQELQRAAMLDEVNLGEKGES